MRHPERPNVKIYPYKDTIINVFSQLKSSVKTRFNILGYFHTANYLTE